jgi:hypothetical protein
MLESGKKIHALHDKKIIIFELQELEYLLVVRKKNSEQNKKP